MAQSTTETVFEALRADHEIQRGLVDRLVQTSGDSEDRDELYTLLRCELQAHADAEERYFYVPLIEHDRTQEKARHSVAEHQELDDLIEGLEDTDRSSSGWLATAKTLAERLIHHLDEEEHEVFQVAGKALSDDQKLDLAGQYRDEMERRRDAHR